MFALQILQRNTDGDASAHESVDLLGVGDLIAVLILGLKPQVPDEGKDAVHEANERRQVLVSPNTSR